MPICKSCKADIPKGTRIKLKAPYTNVTVTFQHLDKLVSLCPMCQCAALKLALEGVYEAFPDTKPRVGPKPAHVIGCRCSKCCARKRAEAAGEEANGE